MTTQKGNLAIFLAFGVLFVLLCGSVYYNFQLSQKNAELEQKQASPAVTQYIQTQPADSINNNSDTVMKFTPTSSGSKTYASTKGFSVDLPAELPVVNETILPITDLYPNPPVNVDIQGASMSMNITTANSPSKLSINNALGEGPMLKYKYDLINNNNNNFKMIKIAGIDAIRADGVEGPSGMPATDVIFFKDGIIYEISFYPVTADNTRIFEAVLNSFRFN